MAEDDTGTTGGDTEEQDTSTGEQEQGAGSTGEQEGQATDKPKPWAPPSEAEWKAQQEKTKRANGQAAAARREADELKRKGETDQEAAVRTAREEAEQGATKAWKPRYVRQAARAALVSAGLTGTPDRLLKLIDVDAVEVGDDDELSGLDDQIRGLKRDYPELFAKRGGGRIDAGDKGEQAGPRDGLSDTSRRLLQQSRA